MWHVQGNRQTATEHALADAWHRQTERPTLAVTVKSAVIIRIQADCGMADTATTNQSPAAVQNEIFWPTVSSMLIVDQVVGL